MASCRNWCKISRCSPALHFRVCMSSRACSRSLNSFNNSFQNATTVSKKVQLNISRSNVLSSIHHYPPKENPSKGRCGTSRNYSSYPTHEVVKMPNLSPTMEVGTIISWEKAEGERIEEGEVLAIIETDKSTMEMETPEEGYLAKIIIPVASKDIPVNQPIAIIVSEEEDIAAFQNYSADDLVSSSDPVVEESASSPPPSPTTTPLPTTTPPVQTKSPTPAAQPATQTSRVFASPLARRAALEKNIDINNVVGTGPRGRIRMEDVEAHKPGTPALSTPQATAVPPTGSSYTDVDLSNMRKTIAKRLAESKQTVPHYYLSVDVNMTNVLNLRQQLNDSGNEDFKLSVNDFIIKASALSLKKVPQCNSQWMNDFIREFHNVDVCVAVSTEAGLITPIVFDADKKGLQYINNDVVSLAKKARDKTIQPHEFMGGTFTISNLGMYGITNFSAVINPPQSCILAVGATEDRLVPDASVEQGFGLAKMMSVTLSCDHRVVDGAVGAQWLKAFRAYLEKPMTMLL